MPIVEIVFAVLGTAVLALLLYYFFLAAASLWPAPRATTKLVDGRTRFTILVAARNEETLIGRTVDSLASLDYPEDLFRIVVIADNCVDRTAEIAITKGAECLIRHDPTRCNKGHALSWAFRKLIPDDPADAFVIVDADTVANADLLAVLSNYLSKGHNSIQVYYDVIEPERSPLASLAYVGYALSRNLRDRGRTRLGWCASLDGNGMCFARSVIERFGWNAHSLSEDLEYQLQLLLGGIRTVLASETMVAGEAPHSLLAYHEQRTRWDTGRFRLASRYLPLLLSLAFRKRDLRALDVALHLIAPPYTLLGGFLFAMFGSYLMLAGQGLSLNHLLWGGMCASFVVYVVTAMIIVKAPARVYLNLLYAPVTLVSRILIALRRPFVTGEAWGKASR